MHNPATEKLEQVRIQIEKLAKIINAPGHLLPTYGNSREGLPNVEISETGLFSYALYERGQPLNLEYAADVNSLLYLIFRYVTSVMASDHVTTNLEGDVDRRRLWFNYQLELLGRLNKDWQQMEKQHQEAVAFQFPFKDYQGKRETYLRKLLGDGFLYHEAIEKVKQKYP